AGACHPETEQRGQAQAEKKPKCTVAEHALIKPQNRKKVAKSASFYNFFFEACLTVERMNRKILRSTRGFYCVF
ncbi:MAG: hypothetical protein WCS43_11210, partial [Verrucomicrobiota bacterium]